MLRKLMIPLVLLLAVIAGPLVTSHAETLSGKLIIAGSTSVQPLADELASEFMAKHPQVRIQVQGGGSSAGIMAAGSGAADIGTSSRELKPTEAGLKVTKIAMDGIAVIVHPANKVSKLTTDQIKKIFAGQITNWKQVGGKDGKIMVVTREAGSGTRGAFEELVMGKTAIAKSAIVQGSTGAVVNTVAQAKGAIGYASMGSLGKQVKAVLVDGVVASEANVHAKKYKISRPFLFLTKKTRTGVAKAFVDYVLSKEGQKIVSQEFIAVSK